MAADGYDPHRYNPDVHYRLYAKRGGKPTVVCLQDFDYYDLTEGEFLSPDAWDSEAEAESALDQLRAAQLAAVARWFR